MAVNEGLHVRPYQLMCVICLLGGVDPEPGSAGAGPLLATVRQKPDLPLTLVCNAGDVYAYQDPGLDDDSPEGHEFNRKRDLDILCRLDLAPGTTLPARTAFQRLLKVIHTSGGICGYGAQTAPAWQGCPAAGDGSYERGALGGIGAVIPPRDKELLAREKARSVHEIRTAPGLRVRPHILMCVVCHFGAHGTEPIEADNIVEFLDVIRRNPDIPVTMARGADWMICAPCPYHVPSLNACVNVTGSGGLSNEKRDLDLLQSLGLTYGSTLAAREMYRLLFERVPTTAGLCRRDNSSHSVWWDSCGESNRLAGNEGYEKGRAILMEELT